MSSRRTDEPRYPGHFFPRSPHLLTYGFQVLHLGPWTLNPLGMGIFPRLYLRTVLRVFGPRKKAPKVRSVQGLQKARRYLISIINIKESMYLHKYN